MYLFTVGVILDIESDNDNESDKPLIVCLTLASVSPREIESLNALNFADSLDNESLVEIVSDNCLCNPCVLANKSVITT